MKIEKKYIVAGVIALGSITAALIYLQFKKLQDYCVSIKKIKLNSFNVTTADVDLILNFLNKSSLKINLISQQYLVYLNGVQVSKVSNAVTQIIYPQSTSSLSVKIQFNPQTAVRILQANIMDIISNPSATTIKIEMSIRVGIGIFKFNIVTDYTTTLKELLTSSDPNSTAKKC